VTLTEFLLRIDEQESWSELTTSPSRSTAVSPIDGEADRATPTA
jgi:hypothetical protein